MEGGVPGADAVPQKEDALVEVADDGLDIHGLRINSNSALHLGESLGASGKDGRLEIWRKHLPLGAACEPFCDAKRFGALY